MMWTLSLFKSVISVMLVSSCWFWCRVQTISRSWSLMTIDENRLGWAAGLDECAVVCWSPVCVQVFQRPQKPLHSVDLDFLDLNCHISDVTSLKTYYWSWTRTRTYTYLCTGTHIYHLPLYSLTMLECLILMVFILTFVLWNKHHM